MILVVDPHSGVPVYRQLVDQIRFGVASGRLDTSLTLSGRGLDTDAILKSLTGTKENAIRAILEPFKHTVKPTRGFYPTRFDADIQDALTKWRQERKK